MAKASDKSKSPSRGTTRKRKPAAPEPEGETSVAVANGVYQLTTDATANTVSITFTPTGGSASAAVVKSVVAGTTESDLITGLSITMAATLADGTDTITTGNNLFAPVASGQEAASGLSVLSSVKTAGSLLAASSGYNEPGNAANAIALGQLQDLTLTSLSQNTITQYYQGRVAALGARAQQSTSNLDNQSSLLAHIEATRSSVSGVSLDEESANLIRFQRSFQASARVLTTIDSMLELVINRLGLTGR